MLRFMFHGIKKSGGEKKKGYWSEVTIELRESDKVFFGEWRGRDVDCVTSAYKVKVECVSTKLNVWVGLFLWTILLLIWICRVDSIFFSIWIEFNVTLLGVIKVWWHYVCYHVRSLGILECMCIFFCWFDSDTLLCWDEAGVAFCYWNFFRGFFIEFTREKM